MKDFLKTEVGNAKRELLIQDITKKEVKLKDGKKSDKIVFHTIEEGTDREFEISDSYVETTDGDTKIAGLWFSQNQGKINQSSALAKVLNYYNADSLLDLLDETIIAYPDKNNYLVLTACPIE